MHFKGTLIVIYFKYIYSIYFTLIMCSSQLDFMQIYVDRYQYSNAVNTDLWNCFTDVSTVCMLTYLMYNTC